MKKIQVFSDFDGTITKEDTLFSFLTKYADKKWLEIENDWVEGKIGSKECIEKQMELFENMSDDIIDKFLETIEIDETFVEFYNYLKSENIEFYVVSDGFDLFIKRIFKRYGLDDVKVFSNSLKFEKGKFYTSFPNENQNCKRKSGTCKCKVLKDNRIVTNRVIYAGDGLSDFCVSKIADIVFAKEKLLEYCKINRDEQHDTKNVVYPFEKFKDIERYIKTL